MPTHKPKPIKYEKVSHIEPFASNEDAKSHVFQAVLRGALVSAWLADTGNWCVSVTERKQEVR